jgi:DNA-binding winged helix-turn-helix (wHTH) protein/tetratricopeptide (TPR) repeat protein
MVMIPLSVRAARFGPFEVDLRAGELRKQDRRIRLQDQPLHVLAALLEHPGEMVTREELRQRLWPSDTFVDFDHGLNNAINRLREALGDSVEKPTYIQTIPRRGYRFIAAVEDAGPEPPQASLKQTPAGLDPPVDPISFPATTAIPEPARAPWRRVAGPWGFGVASVLALAVIVLAIAGGGRGQRSPRAPSPSQSPNREAQEYYLRAKPYVSLVKADDNEAAIGLLEKAVALDPNFAVAYVALGNAYRIRGFGIEPQKREWEEKAFAAVQRALQLDPNLAGAYVLRSRLQWTPTNHWGYERAVQEAHHALELDPNLPEAHLQLGDLYNHVGLLDRAAAELQEAVALDPFNTRARFRLGVNLLFQARYDEALTALRDAQRFDPNLWAFQTSFALFQLDRRQQAKERVTDFLRKNLEDDPRGLLTSLQALFAAAEGDMPKAEHSIGVALTKDRGYPHFHHTEYIVAAAYARMKNTQLAMRYLQQAADNGFPCYTFFEKDTNLDSLRGDPRFREFMIQQKKQWEHFKATM